MRRTERGVSAVAVAVVLALLCGFVALSLDVGHLLSVRGELQNGSDAGALAGAKSLTGRNTSGELGDAVDKARLYATSHPTDRYNVEPKTIELGAWVPSDHACPDTAVGVTTQRYGYKFCQITATSEEAAADINAVRVVSAREGTPGATGGGAVVLGFGGVVAHKEPAPVGAEAIALAGGPCQDAKACLPFAIRAGCIYHDGKIRCDDDGVGPVYYIGLSSAPADSAGITSLSDVVSASGMEACRIIKSCRTATDDINIQNGNDFPACDPGCTAKDYTGAKSGAAGKDSLCEVVRRLADADCDGNVDRDAEGKYAFSGRIPVVQYDGESIDYCDPAGQYNGQAEKVGWATISIVSVRCEGSETLPPGTVEITRKCDEYMATHGIAGSKCIAIQLFCDQVDPGSTRVGCGWFGTIPIQPVLVR